jgi:hypothetical protein
MGYVQVPVPAEHVVEVLRWVLFRAEGGKEQLQEDVVSVTRLLGDVDDLRRTLLINIANATVADESLRLRDLADDLGVDSETVTQILDDLNRHALNGGRQLLELRREKIVGVYGQTASRSFVGMRPDLAPVVRSSAAAAADQAG